MNGHQLIVNSSKDQVTIETDDGKLTFSGRHSITALARDIDKAVGLLFTRRTPQTIPAQIGDE